MVTPVNILRIMGILTVGKLKITTSGPLGKKTTHKSDKTSLYVSSASVPRQQPHMLSGTIKEKPRPQLGPDTLRPNNSASAGTADSAPQCRPKNTVQSVDADIRPAIQRVPTGQSVKGCPGNMKVTEKAPQLDKILPEPHVQMETIPDSSGIQHELAHFQAAVKEREHTLAKALTEKEDQIQTQAVQIQELLGLNGRLERKIDELDVELKEEQTKTKKLTQAWNRSTAALSQAQRQEASYKIDDKAIESLWQELNYRVADWADTNCVHDMRRLPEADMKPFQTAAEPYFSLTPAPQNYLRHKRTQPLLLRSLLMKMLVHDVFTVATINGGGAWWAGDQAQAMQSLYNMLIPGKPYT
jgi:hypothetical protein